MKPEPKIIAILVGALDGRTIREGKRSSFVPPSDFNDGKTGKKTSLLQRAVASDAAQRALLLTTDLFRELLGAGRDARAAENTTGMTMDEFLGTRDGQAVLAGPRNAAKRLVADVIQDVGGHLSDAIRKGQPASKGHETPAVDPGEPPRLGEDRSAWLKAVAAFEVASGRSFCAQFSLNDSELSTVHLEKLALVVETSPREAVDELQRLAQIINDGGNLLTPKQLDLASDIALEAFKRGEEAGQGLGKLFARAAPAEEPVQKNPPEPPLPQTGPAAEWIDAAAGWEVTTGKLTTADITAGTRDDITLASAAIRASAPYWGTRVRAGDQIVVLFQEGGLPNSDKATAIAMRLLNDPNQAVKAKAHEALQAIAQFS